MRDARVSGGRAEGEAGLRRIASESGTLLLLLWYQHCTESETICSRRLGIITESTSRETEAAGAISDCLMPFSRWVEVGDRVNMEWRRCNRSKYNGAASVWSLKSSCSSYTDRWLLVTINIVYKDCILHFMCLQLWPNGKWLTLDFQTD